MMSPGQLERFLLIALLASLAVAQPLFDLLGKQAEFLVAHRLGGNTLLLFTLALALLIPGGIALACDLARRISKRLGAALFHFLFFLLACLIALPPIINAGLEGAPSLGAAALASVSAMLLYRHGAVRLFFKYLSPAVLLFPLIFLFASRAAPLLLESQAPGESTAVKLKATPEIVVLVLDEFPLVSLLNADLEIDRERYPNFARLADISSWYRGATTPSEVTVSAVPALLTGLEPEPGAERLPVVANYPRNLFTLLEGRYRMEVSEVTTRLSPVTGESSEAEQAGQSVASFINDLLLVYRHLVTPQPWAERLPSISNAWSRFEQDAHVPADPGPDAGGFEQARRLADQWRLFPAVRWHGRGQQFEQFVEKIERRDRPGLYYLHSLLPHAEWRYLPAGQQYLARESWEALRDSAGPDDTDIWHEDSHAVNRKWQRHLLQVMYVDRLLGLMLDRLEQQGMLEDSLLVVAGDHGAGFVPGHPRRSITEGNLSDISAVPLFIHVPGQTAPAIFDRAVSLNDVFPSIAATVAEQLDWRLDGRVLGSEPAAQDTVRILKKNGKLFEYPFSAHMEHLRGRAAELERLFGSGSNSRLYQLGPRPDLLGTVPGPASVTASNGAEVTIDEPHLFENVVPGSMFLPLRIRGEISGLPITDPVTLAVGVNGVIRATSQTFAFEPHLEAFTAMLPDGALQPGSNIIEIFLVQDSARGTTLVRLNRIGQVRWELVRFNGGEQLSDGSETGFTVQAERYSGHMNSVGTPREPLIILAGSTGESGPSDATVLAFMDGRLAAAGTADGRHFSFRIATADAGPAETVRVRVFALDREDRTAIEVGSPPPCSPDWAFAEPGSWDGIDCDTPAASPLLAQDGRYRADLRMGDPAVQPYMTEGWSNGSAGVRWSVGKSAGIEIPLPTETGPLKFSAWIKPFLHPPQLSAQTLWISANDQVIGSWELVNTRFERIEWRIPADVLGIDPETLRLGLLLPDAASPRLIGAGADVRMLGIALLRLEIESEAAGAPGD